MSKQSFKTFAQWREAVRSRGLIMESPTMYEGMHESDPFTPTDAVDQDGFVYGHHFLLEEGGHEAVLFENADDYALYLHAEG